MDGRGVHQERHVGGLSCFFRDPLVGLRAPGRGAGLGSGRHQVPEAVLNSPRNCLVGMDVSGSRITPHEEAETDLKAWPRGQLEVAGLWLFSGP